MKKILVIIFLFFTAFSFAQQGSPSVFNYRPSDSDLLMPNGLKHSLNMDSFKLEDLDENTRALSESLKKFYNQSVIPTNNMPIFAPEGRFFLEIYEVNEDIDHKLRIIDFEKSR